MAQTNHPCLRLSVQDVLCRAEKERGKGLARSYETTSDLGEVYHAWDDSDNQLHSIGTGNIAQGTINKKTLDISYPGSVLCGSVTVYWEGVITKASE